MVCLVTGGAGFIGSNLVDSLIEKGDHVIVIDNESASENEQFYWNSNADNHKIDICDFDQIEPLFENVDFVFHLAAESRIQVSIENPAKAVRTNCLGTVNVLEASRKHKIKKIIYSSTSSYYGLKNKPPLKENMDRDCLNPYSVTKVAAEDIFKMYNHIYKIPVVIFRYFNVYGSRQPTKGQYAPVIGLFQKMKLQGQPLTVVGDGKNRRDYTHVSDIVAANISAINNDSVGNAEVINLGTGKNYSVLEIVDLIGGDYIHIPPRLGEARETLADISKAKKYLNWEPTIFIDKWLGGK